MIDRPTDKADRMVAGRADSRKGVKSKQTKQIEWWQEGRTVERALSAKWVGNCMICFEEGKF